MKRIAESIKSPALNLCDDLSGIVREGAGKFIEHCCCFRKHAVLVGDLVYFKLLMFIFYFKLIRMIFL